MAAFSQAERTIEVLSPISPRRQKEQELASGPTTRDGRVLGVLDNGKPNAGLFLRSLSKIVRERLPFSEVVSASKTASARGPGYPASSGLLDSLRGKVDLVINGIGD